MQFYLNTRNTQNTKSTKISNEDRLKSISQKITKGYENFYQDV